ncbi:MAG TPA: competence protein CoiA family protein [Terriglobales bacterium]|nr:competence protein CoiA family protein [Terriglobales bacterium]
MAHAPVSDYASSNADLVYAVDERGKIVHVSESQVVSGLACRCRCPACGMSVIAKKGPELADHFAHEADASCRHAAETALHRLAKEIIEQQRKLWLPDVTARYRKETHQLYPAGSVNFTGVQSEARHLHEIVPDLLLELDDRILLVEIWVTHSCDEAKRNELARKGIATLEIDLSKFPRSATREEVARAVLKEADRRWVYHPKIEAEIAAMRAANEAEQRREKKAFEKKLDKAEVDYRSALQHLAARQPAPLNREADIFRAGYGDHIGIAVDGAGCFTVSAEEWQFVILRDAFAPREDIAHPAYRVMNLVDWFKKRELIRSAFNYVAPEIEQGLVARDIGFLSPYRSMEKYLEELRQRGVLHKRQAYYSAPGLVDAVNQLRESDRRRKDYRESLVERGERILQKLPEAERRGLTGMSWLDIPQSNGISLAEALKRDAPNIGMVFFTLRSIEDMIFSKGRMVDETLGLPITTERGRQQAARKEEDEAREAAKLQSLRDAESVRIQCLQREASKLLQGDSDRWITTANRELDNKAPLDMARSGEGELDHALTVLDREARRRGKAEEYRIFLADLRSQLEAKIAIILGPAARPFLASPYPELDRKRPMDYCVSAKTMQVCLELAEKVRRARR